MAKGLKILIELSQERNRKKYSLVPAHAMPVPKYEDRTANGLTRCIIDYINILGGQAERISNTGRYIDQTKVVSSHIGQVRTIGSGKWIPGQGTKGTADVSATFQGRSVKVEVKIGADRQSAAQIKYQQSIEEAGGIYIIASTFDRFYTEFNNKFLI